MASICVNLPKGLQFPVVYKNYEGARRIVRGQLNVSLLLRRSMGLSRNLPPSSLVVTIFIATVVFQATTPDSSYGLIAQSENNITRLVSSRRHTTSYRGGSAG